MAELYREERGSGAPLLLIHGNGSNTLTWGRTLDDLAAERRVISYDRRGFGRSPGPPAARRLAKILPAARHVAIPNAGHGVHFDQPERFRDEVLADLPA